MVWDPITMVNLVLCVVILVFGFLGWRRTKNLVPLYIAIAFGLFGVSHLATILGLKGALETVLIVVRTAAYLLVAYAVYQIAQGRN